MPPVPIIELAIFAVLAAVVLYNLYAVLGRRIGRQPGDSPQPATVGVGLNGQPPRIDPAAPDVELTGLAALRARDPAFDAEKFLEGSRGAYEMIVRAFASGDRATLKGLLAPEAMNGFDRAITAREAEGRTESAEFLHPPRADIEQSEVDADPARVRVRFLAEYRRRTGGADGEKVEDRRTAEVWTFERNLNSRDPNWTLVRVDAAEA